MRRAVYSKHTPKLGAHCLADKPITLIVYSPIQRRSEMSIPIPYIGTIGFQDHAKSRLSYFSRSAYITTVIVGLFRLSYYLTFHVIYKILYISSGEGTRTPVIWLMRPSWNHLQSTPGFILRSLKVLNLDLRIFSPP